MNAPTCEATRIFFGRCVREPHPDGWHENADGRFWPEYDDEPTLDAILTGPTYRIPAAEVTQ